MMINRLKNAIAAASDSVVYLPVQRQNMHGGQMVPEMVAAIPIPVWEELCEAFDEEEEEDVRARA